MTKDTIKKKDQLGILAENMNSQFGLIMESFSVLTKQIKEVDERLSAKIDGVDQRLSAKIDNFQTETNSKFETIFSYLSTTDSHPKRIEGLEKRMVTAEKQLTKIK